MADYSSTFRVAQIFGITSSTFLSGFAFSASYLGLPALALSPVALRVRQWLVIYDLGKLVSPTVAAASTVAWTHVTYVSYISRALPSTAVSGTPKWVSYGIAGLATFGIPLWTGVVMMPTNNELIRRANLNGKSDVDKADLETEKLLKTWKQMNYFRAVLPMVGVVVGLWAALI